MSATEKSAEKLVQDLKDIVRDGEDLLRATAGDMSDKAEDARERLSSALDTSRKTCLRLEDKAMASAKATDKAVREHPYQFIGGALALGLLIGVLVNRK